MKENHKKFQKHLSKSQEHVDFAAQWLSSRGHKVHKPNTTVADSHSDWQNHADDGDLLVKIKSKGEWNRVEIKKLSADFTSAKDWPFKPHFIVCAKHSFDRAKKKPYAFLIFNKNMSHLACVMSKYQNQWTSQDRKDSRYTDVSQKFYLSPLNLVSFMSVN